MYKTYWEANIDDFQSGERVSVKKLSCIKPEKKKGDI
jgi:hypothetical protein